MCNTCPVKEKQQQEENVLPPETSANTSVDTLNQENQFLKRLVKELEEKNQLLLENKKLLEEKVVELERRQKIHNTEQVNVINNQNINSNQATVNKLPTLSPRRRPTYAGALQQNASSSNQTVSNNLGQQNNESTLTWKTVNRKKTKRQFGTAEGTAQEGNANDEDKRFMGKQENPDKKVWLFISKVKDAVVESDIKAYLKKKSDLEDKDIVVEHITTPYDESRKDCKCFKIGIKYELKDTVYEQGFWPRGVAYSRYNFKRVKNTNDFLALKNP